MSLILPVLPSPSVSADAALATVIAQAATPIRVDDEDAVVVADVMQPIMSVLRRVVSSVSSFQDASCCLLNRRST